jgi:hypothetical protein
MYEEKEVTRNNPKASNFSYYPEKNRKRIKEQFLLGKVMLDVFVVRSL